MTDERERLTEATMAITEAQWRVLKWVKANRLRPEIRSPDWDVFLELVDLGLVEDGGMGNARLTAAGRRVRAPLPTPGGSDETL